MVGGRAWKFERIRRHRGFHRYRRGYVFASTSAWPAHLPHRRYSRRRHVGTEDWILARGVFVLPGVLVHQAIFLRTPAEADWRTNGQKTLDSLRGGYKLAKHACDSILLGTERILQSEDCYFMWRP